MVYIVKDSKNHRTGGCRNEGFFLLLANPAYIITLFQSHIFRPYMKETLEIAAMLKLTFTWWFQSIEIPQNWSTLCINRDTITNTFYRHISVSIYVNCHIIFFYASFQVWNDWAGRADSSFTTYCISRNICWSSRRLEDVLKTCLEEVLKTRFQDVFKTYWRQAKY